LALRPQPPGNGLHKVPDHSVAVRQPEDIARALVLMNVNVLFERLGRAGVDKPAAVARTLQVCPRFA